MEVKNQLREFGKKAGQYFLDFLETDFKRQRPPRRRVQLKNEANQTTGVALRKYPNLHDAIIELLSKDSATTKTLIIPRRRYTASVSPQLKDLAFKFIDEIDSEKFREITRKVLAQAKNGRELAISDLELCTETIYSVVQEETAAQIIRPLLNLLETSIQSNAYSAVESLFELETDLVAALTQECCRELPGPLNSYIVTGDDLAISLVLAEFLDEIQSRQRLKDFIESFAVSDVWQELRDLRALTRMGDNLQLYLYVCDIRFGPHIFPVVYIPLTITQEDSSDKFIIHLDSRLCVNKRALDFVAQELEIAESVRLNHQIEERIIYLEPDQIARDSIANILGRLKNLFDLDADIILEGDSVQTGKSSKIKLSTACYFAVFDRADEALLNDYEALLNALKSEEKDVGALFEEVLNGFLLHDPLKVDSKVDNSWRELSIPNRLLTESPIPLNEEQRKVLMALNDPNVRYLIVYGPPGTGKSHSITAIAFECILKGQTILVLSDKMEALDVVEDKLTEAMNSVRPSDSFQNPILRLGKTGGTYTKLLKQEAVETIRNQYRAAASHHKEIEEGIGSLKGQLSNNIENSIKWMSGISLKDIEQFHILEASLKKRAPEIIKLIEEGSYLIASEQIEKVRAWQNSDEFETALEFLAPYKSASIERLLKIMRKATAATQMDMLVEYKNCFSAFRNLKPNDSRGLQEFVLRYEELRLPLLGYFGAELFRGGTLNSVSVELGKKYPLENVVKFHKKVKDLEQICSLLPKAADIAKAWQVSDDEFEDIYERIVHHGFKFPDFSAFLSLAETINKNFKQLLELNLAEFNSTKEVFQFYLELADLMYLWNKLMTQEKNIPCFDFIGERGQLEELCTTKMTLEMDSRFVQFVEQASATAKTLSTVIRTKQKFPKDAFERLRDAFPCIIASIREFAEYIPLHTGMFDLVVIDEASQVSVAQAFPALLRAKKVLVLGDQKQFSNIKAAYASNERNAVYINDIKDYFRRSIADGSDKLARAACFDIKKSVLDFFELIGNYSVMLRKHFRGYQELISFSSQYFYNNRLQAVKLRGKPIEEVIKFTVLDHDGRSEKYRNANSQEAEFIISQLNEYLKLEEPPTIGIISPFREQVALISQMVLAESNARLYEERLKLKIMTFDTCQGEERELILYSMVATEAHDALNFIFPVSLKDTGDRVEEQLKMQRLNVGLSRAEECMHFILSKPIDQFTGSIRTALQHYQLFLTDKDKVEADKTDALSPMESNLLYWLKDTDFFYSNQDQIELRPQFPIGDYLKQLDPMYQHPSYRVDFLLIFRDGAKTINVVIEYDGFEEHFIEHKKVHDGNWAFYCKPEDIERQMVLESYGYKFLRVNRFNLGSDPVKTLSERLYTLINTARHGQRSHAVTAKVQEHAEGLNSGEMKFCSKCERSKPKEDFANPALTTGYGRTCRECQGSPRKASKNPTQDYQPDTELQPIPHTNIIQPLG